MRSKERRRLMREFRSPENRLFMAAKLLKAHGVREDVAVDILLTACVPPERFGQVSVAVNRAYEKQDTPSA